MYAFAAVHLHAALTALHIYANATWASWTLGASFIQSCCRGWTVSVTQVLLMASPLSGLLRAVQQRSSANFHLGVCSMGLVSSTLWTIYAMVALPEEACEIDLKVHSLNWVHNAP